MSDIERHHEDPSAALSAAMDDLRRLTAEAEMAMAQRDEEAGTTALVPTSSNVPATAVKAQLATKRAEIVKKRAQIEQLSKEIEARVQAQMEELTRVLQPMQEMVSRLEEGIWTVNLYLGRDESIVTLAEGEPAEASTPITVRQLVLSMDQESMVAASDGGIDAANIDAFDEWITSDRAHLDQVLPEAKGVVVLVPRRNRDRDYGNPWLQQRMDEANHRSYWLIRNGDKLFRMSTSFDVGERLIPARDEFTSFFRVRDYTGAGDYAPLVPGSSQWMAAEKAADSRKRHFMRVALVLQGLIDRTPVFHPLPDGGVNLLDPDTFDRGAAVLVTDAEAALGTGREPFFKWLSRHNATLRPGMRVVCAFNSEQWRSASRVERDWDPQRVTPKGAKGLRDGKLYTIEARKAHQGAEALVIRFERTDMKWETYTVPAEEPGYVYERSRQVPYEKRASAYLYASDRFVLPYDAVTIEEMQGYLNARTERHAYVTMVPLLKAAIDAKLAERAEEAPFRLMLAGLIHAETGEDIETVTDALADLVDWWKLANRHHRPLVGEGPEGAKAVAAIVAEHKRRRAADAVSVTEAAAEAAMVAKLRELHPDAVLVARKRDRSYVVLEAADDRLAHAHRHTYTTTGRPKGTASWVLVGTSWRRWRILHADERWDRWDHGASAATHLSGVEIEALCDELATKVPEGYRPVRIRLYKSEGFFELDSFKPIDLDEVWPEHPLTGQAVHGVPAMTVKARWRRSTGGRVQVRSGRPYEQIWHWNDKNFDDDGRYWLTVRSFETARSDLLALLEAGTQRDRVASQLASQVRGVVAAVEAAYDERTLEEARLRFLDDYGDMDLWEGHRKTLTLAQFPPQWRTQVTRIAEVLVERGAMPAGELTVAKAAALAGRLTGTAIEVDEALGELMIGETLEP